MQRGVIYRCVAITVETAPATLSFPLTGVVVAPKCIVQNAHQGMAGVEGKGTSGPSAASGGRNVFGNQIGGHIAKIRRDATLWPERHIRCDSPCESVEVESNHHTPHVYSHSGSQQSAAVSAYPECVLSAKVQYWQWQLRTGIDGH